VLLVKRFFAYFSKKVLAYFLPFFTGLSGAAFLGLPFGGVFLSVSNSENIF
jgi:hypothetical protein